MTRGISSLIGEVNDLRTIKRRLKALIKDYEKFRGFGILEVSGESVYEQLLEVLTGERPAAHDEQTSDPGTHV